MYKTKTWLDQNNLIQIIRTFHNFITKKSKSKFYDVNMRTSWLTLCTVISMNIFNSNCSLHLWHNNIKMHFNCRMTFHKALWISSGSCICNKDQPHKQHGYETELYGEAYVSFIGNKLFCWLNWCLCTVSWSTWLKNYEAKLYMRDHWAKA